MTFAIIISLCAFLMSLLGTRITILALRQRQEMQLQWPLGKKQGVSRVPVGGGVAVVMAMSICLLVADIPYPVILSLFMLAAASLLDDFLRIPVFVRLLIQFFAVLLPLQLIHYPFFDAALPVLVEKAIIIIVWMWWMNLSEYMDGIDGITPTQMVGMSLGVCMLSIMDGTFPTPLARYALVVFAVALGFMWWNWYPSKIRLGEVGTIPIGFITGYLLLMSYQNSYSAAAMILPAYYVSDGLFTLVRRVRKGKEGFAKHSEYYYSRAIRKGRRPDTVSRYVFGLNMLLISLSVFSVLHPELVMLYIGLAYMSVCMVLGFFAYSPANPNDEPF